MSNFLFIVWICIHLVFAVIEVVAQNVAGLRPGIGDFTPAGEISNYVDDFRASVSWTAPWNVLGGIWLIINSLLALFTIRGYPTVTGPESGFYTIQTLSLIHI